MFVRQRGVQHLTSASIASEGSVRIVVLVGHIGGLHDRSVRRTVEDWGITVVVVTVCYPRDRWQSKCHVLRLVNGHRSVWVRSSTTGGAIAIRIPVSCKPRPMMGATIDGGSRLTVGRNPWAIPVKQIVDAIVRYINSRMQCSWLLVVAGGCWLLLVVVGCCCCCPCLLKEGRVRCRRKKTKLWCYGIRILTAFH
jgi:hypothetical protein